MKRKEYINLLVWYKTAKKGQRVEYYKGFLMNDRKTDKFLSNCADIALKLYESNHLILFQKKISNNVYSYIAQRTRKK